MALSRSRLEAEAKRSITNGRWRLWEELIVQTLFQSESLGFDLLVIYPGHYPMHTPVARAVETFKSKGGISYVFILTDHLVAQGDHAAAFETSLLLFLAPDLVDLSTLSPTDTMHLGVLGEDPLKHASEELGRSTVAQFLAIVQEQIQLSKERKKQSCNKK
jgi:creatinine amidohydrolase/Fe(II)-dependent formamide hydrolase-like protein